MNAQNKTKEELAEELQNLRIEHNVLKASCEKYSTERKGFEDSRRAGEENFRSIFENNSAAMALIEPDTTISMVNEEYCKISGYTKQEIIGMSWTQQIPPQDLERLNEYNRLRLINPKDAPDKYEFTFYQMNGNIKHALMSITMLSNRKIIASFVDITERKISEMALLESESSLNAIFNAADVSIFLLSADETCIAVNEIGAKRLGRTRKETLGCKLADVLPPEIEAHRRPFFNRALLMGENVTFEDERNGRWMVNNLYPILNNDGQAVRLVIYSRDITERKMVEKALTESEEKYRVLLNGSSYGILATDVETRQFVFSNPTIRKLFGYTDEEFQRLSIVNLVPKESLDLVMSEFDSQMRGDKSVSFSQTCLKKDGTVFYADIAGAPILLNGRKCSVGFFNDVTEHKKAEEELLQEQYFMYSLMDNLPDHIYFKDLDSRFVRNNKAHVMSFGLIDTNQMVGKSDFDFFEKEVAQRQYEDEQQIIRKGQPINKEEFTVRNDGSINWYYSTKMPLRDKNGIIVGTFGISRDITDRKRAEQELIKAKEHAEESDRLKSAFLANMSHEIRTPMNGILGFSELLKEPNLTGEEQQEYIRIIDKSGKRLLNIIHDIVDISKIESGQMEVSISETNINQQIEYLYSFFKPESERKGLQLLIDNALPSAESIINTDRDKLYAILTNLVKNAIKFTQNGSIKFGYKKKGKYLEFFVKDTGIGIPENQKKIIFERFRQGSDLTSRFNEGTGLGLSISKAYVEILGGKIWLESELGKGSTFYFTLPYNAETEAKPNIKSASSGIGADNQVGNLKILIAEDDESSGILITTVLKKFGKEFLAVGTGVEAVEACRRKPDINLVLMDIKMPEMDGFEATRQIRQFNKNVVIIAQTAYGLAGDSEKAIDAGCNDYISKPIVIEELKGLIQKYFNR